MADLKTLLGEPVNKPASTVDVKSLLGEPENKPEVVQDSAPLTNEVTKQETVEQPEVKRTEIPTKPDKEKESILAGVTSPQERNIISTALDRTNEHFKNLGGKTPYQKMQEFDSRLQELNKKYDPKSFAAMTDESLAKVEDQYKNDARALAIEIGLDVDQTGQITAPANEREMFSRKMGEYMAGAENEVNKANKPGFFGNLASSLASGYERASGAALDLLGTVSGLNYFDSYKDLSEGNRHNADVFKQQASKYDQTIEEYAKQGDLGKATGLAVTSAIESLPYMLPAMVNPQYGVYVMGGMSGIDKYRELEPKNIPQWEKAYNSLSTAAFEAIFEKVGTGAILSRSKRAMLEMGEKKGREAIVNAVNKTVENSASKLGRMPEWVKEGLSEVATGIGQNLTDKVTFNPDQNIGEGALDNFVVGAIMGKAFALPQDVAKFAERQAVKEFATKVLDKLPADMDIETKINLGWKIAERDKLQEAEDKLDPKFKGKYATQLVTLNSEIDKAAEDYLSKAKVEEVPELSVGKMDEVGTEQAKLDYLQEQGVKVPDGATMEELNELYDTEKAKVESTDTSKKEQADSKVAEVSKEPVVEYSDKPIPDTDFNGQKIMSPQEWNTLPKEEQRKLDKTITEEVTDNKGNSFPVDKGLAPFLRRIFKLGVNTGQSDSGMVGDHPNYRYVADDKNGEYVKGDIIGKGSGAYLTFWKPEAEQIRDAGREINSQEQIDNIKNAAVKAGFEVLDTQVFFNPSLRISLPYTTDGTGRQAILKEANDRANEKYPGLYDSDFMQWLDYRNHVFEPEVTKDHGGRVEYTDKMINDKWNEFVTNLEQLSSPENISSETKTEVPENKNISENETEKVSEIKSDLSENQPTVNETGENSLQKEKLIPENTNQSLQKEEPLTTQEENKVAEKTGIKPKNLRDVYTAGRQIFGLNRVQALAQAVIVDRVIGQMAKRSGKTKEEVYSGIEFRKSELSELSDRGKVLYQAVGQNAQLSSEARANLVVARDLDRNRHSPIHIKLMTGWEKGADQKWRYEIPDNTKFTEVWDNAKEKEKFKLKDALRAPELFAAYPELEDVIISKESPWMDFWGGTQGWFDPDKNELVITPYAQDPLGTAIHEIQHWIQKKEGFAKGGNTESAIETLSDIELKEISKKIVEEKESDIAESEKKIKYLNGIFDNLSDIDRAWVDEMAAKYVDVKNRESDAYDAIKAKNPDENPYSKKEMDIFSTELGVIHEDFRKRFPNLRNDERFDLMYSKQYPIKEQIDNEQLIIVEALRGISQIKTATDKSSLVKILKAEGGDYAYEAYRRLSGETEARNMTARMNMTPEERRKSLLSDTEDVARDEQIILFQGEKGAMQVLEDGKVIVHALTSPDVSTPLHEIAHVYEKSLTDAERASVLKWAKEKEWTVETSEKFARGFEKYLAEGIAPTKELQKIFDKFKEWLTDIYNGIKGSEIDLKLNKPMRDLYDQMLGKETKTKTDEKQEVQATGKEVTPEQKKIKESAKKAADVLRKAKFVKSMNDLNKLSSDPSALLKVAWDGSVEAAAKTIELGGTIAQAVADGIKVLKASDWYKNLSDGSKKIAEERFASDMQAQLEEAVKKAETKRSRYGTRVAYGRKTQSEVKKKYRKEELYNYKEESHGTVDEAADAYLAGATNEEAMENLYNNEIPKRVRTGIAVGLIKRLNEESTPLFQKGDKAAADKIMDKIVLLHDFIQKEVATEAGRDISYLGSNRVMELLGPFQTAELARRGMADSRRKGMERKSFKRTAAHAQKEVEKEKKKVIEEVIEKIVKPKQSKVSPEIEKIRKERSSLIDQWKKKRKSAPESENGDFSTMSLRGQVEGFKPASIDQMLKVKEFQGKGRIRELLNHIINTVSDPNLKRVAKVLLQNSAKSNFVEFELRTPRDNNGYPVDAFGVYRNGKISLNEAAFSFPTNLVHKNGLDGAYKVILHELIHAHTVDSYRNPKTKAEKDFKTYIDKVYAELKLNAEFKKGLYGFNSQTEFIAEILTNPEFQKLAHIYKPTLLDKIIDLIARIFGYTKDIAAVEADRSNKIKQSIDYILTKIPTIRSGVGKKGSFSDTNNKNIPGLTQADIEFIPQLAASFVKEGYYQTKVLVKKIQRILDQEGLKVSDADLETLLPKEYNGKPFAEHQKEEDMKKASLSLAKQIFGDVIDKKNPDSDPIVRMVKTLFSKFKETQLDRKAVEGMSDIEKLALAIREKEKYAKVWTEAKAAALTIVENSKTLSDEQKEAAVERIEAAYKNATQFTFSQKLVADLIREELGEMTMNGKKGIDIGDVVRDHYESKDIVKADLVKSLVEKSGLDPAQAKILADAVDKAFSTLMTARIQTVLKKYTDKATRKTSTKQKKGAEEIIHLASIGAFENDAFKEAFADAWGLAPLNDSDIKYIVSQSEMITKIKSEAIRYEYKQELLAHIANMQGMDWDALIDGFWYANVLSGIGTQTKNFLDAATASTVESFLYTGTRPEQMNRWKNAWLNALKGRGFSNLKSTLRTGNHPFEFGTDAPKQAKRIVDSKEALIRNKLAWKGVKVIAKANNAVFNLMMGNDALWNTVAYESILDALVTKDLYKDNAIKWWSRLSKQQKEELNQKIDEIMKVTPEDQAIIAEMVAQESEDFKMVQAGLGETQVGFSEIQTATRTYEIMDEMRPKALVEEARRLAQMTLGNIQPYGTLGYLMNFVSSAVNTIGFKMYRPLAIKGTDGKIHFTFSSTESMTLRPAAKIIPFTRIITSIAVRSMGWNPVVMAMRYNLGYGFLTSLGGKQTERFRKPLSPHEKKVIWKKAAVLGATYSLLYGLTGGDEPEDGWIRITANGTGDWTKNKQLEASGWRPYSIQFGDFSISYQYVYPLNGILGAFGYARDRQLYKDGGKGFGSFMKELTVGSGVSLAQVLFSTPMSGLNSMFDVMTNVFRGEVGSAGTQLTKLLANIGGGYVAPRALKDMEAAYDILMQRSDIEGVTFWEKMNDKIPFIGRNFAGKVERLDVFGDNFEAKNPFAAVFDRNTSTPTSDLSRWLTEEVKYFRPMPEYGQVTFKVYEKSGMVNKERKLTEGSDTEEALWTEYNRELGRLFKEEVVKQKESGRSPEKVNENLKLKWNDIVDDAKRHVYRKSQDYPLDNL